MKKTSSKTQILLIILFSATLSLVLLKYANPLFYPPGRDGGAYMFGGRHVLHGKILYIDYWEAKGPLIFFINAFGLLIGNDSRWGIWLIEFLFWALSAFLGIMTLKKHFGFLSALVGITVMMMVGNNLVGSGNFTEEYSLLFTWISLFVFFHLLRNPSARLLPFILGAMFTSNFFTRANNAITSGVLILLWLWHTWRTVGVKAVIIHAARVAAGGVMIALPISVYLLLKGAFSEMITASIIYNFAYSFGTRPGIQNLNLFVSGLRAFSALGVWMVLPLIGFTIALIQFFKNLSAKHVDAVSLLLVTAWPLEMLASSISGRNYGHYFLTWLPMMAFLSAYALDFILKHSLPKTALDVLPKWVSSLALGLTVILFSIIYHQDLAQYGISFSRLIFHPDQELEYIHPISAFIAEHSTSEDLVLVWGGQTGLLFMSERYSPTAYNFYPLYANSRIGREIQQRYFEDLQHNPPKLILDAHIHVPDALPSIDPEIKQTQRLIYPIALNHEEVLAYILANYDMIHDENGYQVYQIIESAQN